MDEMDLIVTESKVTYVAAVGDNADSMEMRYEDENIWLTQKMMAELYDISVPAINQHLKTIFSDGEVDENSVIKKYLITAADGKNYNTKHYNLQAIIAVGFKVNNDRAVRFRKSTTLAAGTRLSSTDDNYIGGDLIITHDSEDSETKMYVWDYAAEDGDYVQIIVNGTPQGPPFMIENRPEAFTVPTAGEIEVLGTKDGGGGITYAVYYDMNHTTYFNGVDEGEDNLYTLVKE